MKQKRIAYLLEQYIHDKLTSDEREELRGFAEDGDESGIQEVLVQLLEQETRTAPFRIETSDDHRQELLSRILAVDKTSFGKPVRRMPLFRRNWFAAACVALVVFAAGAAVWKLSPNRPEPVAVVTDPAVPAAYIRNLTLPDGSSVILKEGSTLQYPATFHDEAREVRLTGEAYFDIRHIPGSDEARRFIIHTGNVKTVVLGTAFNIRAYPEQDAIVVSVAKGKVRVEDAAGEVVAVLTQDQQVTYSKEGSDPVAERADIRKATDWTRTDMEFDGVSFETIAQVLEKRYGARIQFENSDLRQCLTVVTFSGTETLDNVLETLCTIRNATYRVELDKQITIDGNGCQ